MSTQTTISKPEKPTVKLLYNNKDCTEDFSKYLNSVTFREFEENESDELSLILNDNDGYFADLWYPEKGDKLTCTILYGTDVYDCGTFTIDENSFSFTTSGDTLEIKAQTTPKTKPVRTKKTINYTGKTLVAIAREIGERQGFKVVGSEGFINVGKIVQKNETDLEFLRRVASEYGYIFNIKDGLLIFTSKSTLYNSDSLFALDKTDLRSLKLTDSLTQVFGSVKVSYYDLKTKKVVTYTAKGNKDITEERIIHKRYSSFEEAKIAADAALKNLSREVKGRIELKMPEKLFMPGVNLDLTGIGKFEGQYHITSSERRVTPNGYTITGEIRKQNILQCKWEQVNFELWFVEVLKQDNKGMKSIKIPLTRTLADMLQKKDRVSEYIFVNPKTGMPFRNCRKSFDTALKRAGIEDFHFHDLRRTVGTWLLTNGVDLRTIQYRISCVIRILAQQRDI